jgi:hypothetical protein
VPALPVAARGGSVSASDHIELSNGRGRVDGAIVAAQREERDAMTTTIATMVSFEDFERQRDADRERLLAAAYRIYAALPAPFHDALVVQDLLHDIALAELDAKRAKWCGDVEAAA